MRVKRVALVASSSVLLLAVVACSGSAGSPPVLPLAAVATARDAAAPSGNQPKPTATSSAAVRAATGGTVVVKSGGAKLAVTIPPRALAADANVVVGMYRSGPPLPAGAAKAPLPAGARFLGGFTVSTGGVALLAPLRVSETAGAKNGQRDPVRVAMYGTHAGAYVDVDSANVAGGVATNANDSRYVGISSATGTRNPYAFYATRSPKAPARIALALTPASSPPYAIETKLQLVASGADANGNPYAYRPSFTLSNSALGSLAPNATNPYAALLTFGALQQAGIAAVSDARTGLSARLRLSDESHRPANGGDRYAYKGTMTETFVRSLPSPMPTSKTTASVTANVVVKGDQTFQRIPNLYDFVTNETDATRLQTTSSKTDAYEGFSTPGAAGTFSYLEYGSNWNDGNGDSLSYVYPQPLVLDRLPNVKPATWSNSGASTIYENEATGVNGAAFSAQRIYATNGTYTETSTYPPGYFGPSSPADHGQIQQNADGSGYYSAPIYGAGDLVYSAPVRAKNGSYAIAYSVYAQASPAPSATPVVTGVIPAWYAPKPVLYRESDADGGVAAIPSSCGASSAFGKRGERLVRQISRLDTILGYSETTTETTYLVAGYGAVCTQLKDVQRSYYDFNGDSPYLFYSQPYQVTTTTETLGLQRSGTNVLGADERRASAVGRAAAFTLVAHSAFARAVERTRRERERDFVSAFHRLILAHAGGHR